MPLRPPPRRGDRAAGTRPNMATCAASGPGMVWPRATPSRNCGDRSSRVSDQVALHVSNRGDRPAESDRAKLQEIPQYPAEPHLCRLSAPDVSLGPGSSSSTRKM